MVLIGLPLSWAGATVVGAALGEWAAGFASMDGLLLLPVLLFTDPGPIGEEIGWRGFALPGLLERANALLASVALGVIWAVWHLPAFVLPGFPQSGGPFLLFTAALVAQSVLITWIYSGASGSVLRARILFHLVVNSTTSLGAGAYPIWVAMLSVAAIWVAVATGPRHLSRRNA